MKKTLAHEWLDQEAHYLDVSQTSYRILEDILNSVDRNLRPGTPQEKMQSVGKTLKDLKFHYARGGSLDLSLRARAIDCRHYSFIYHAVGETLHLPISLVLAKGHIFVRWNENGNSFNWETTQPQAYDDSYMAKRWHVCSSSTQQGAYLNDISYHAAQSIIFDEIAVRFYELGDYVSAIDHWNKSLSLNPLYPEGYFNRGLAHQASGNFQAAISDYTFCLQLCPEFVRAIRNRSGCKKSLGDLNGARGDIELLGAVSRAIRNKQDKGIYWVRG
jgi:tetratricopeptide (TPR) repeat protein